MRLGEIIKKERLNKGLSLQKAADKIGITKPHLFDPESGKSGNPTAKVLNSLREVYGLTADKLLNAVAT